jgi:signal peptidase
MKIFKVIYSIFIVFIVIVALLLIVSVFPITGNIKFMVVQSESMVPAIKMGSVVMVKPVHSTGSGQVSEYKIGDVIAFGPISKTKAPTSHRIYDIKTTNGTITYITKGDANNSPDPGEVKKEDIIGKILFSVPYIGYAINFVKKPVGFALIIIVPALFIIFDEIKNIVKEIKKTKKEKSSPC